MTKAEATGRMCYVENTQNLVAALSVWAFVNHKTARCFGLGFPELRPVPERQVHTSVL